MLGLLQEGRHFMLFLCLSDGVLLALEELGSSSTAWTGSWGASTEQAAFPSMDILGITVMP